MGDMFRGFLSARKVNSFDALEAILESAEKGRSLVQGLLDEFKSQEAAAKPTGDNKKTKKANILNLKPKHAKQMKQCDPRHVLELLTDKMPMKDGVINYELEE